MSQAAATVLESCPRSAVVLAQDLRIPGWIVDLDSFRRWARSETFPQRGRIDFLNGDIWVDVGMEEFLSHNQVKGEYAVVLGGLVKSEDLGRYIHDRMRLINEAADLSDEPDGAFASWATLRRRLRLVPGAEEGYVELEGTPDMVLEVISTSSVHKDTVVLREHYWRAKVPEFWLVDVRREAVRFDILRYTSEGYAKTRKHNGWLKSAAFGKSFRLTRHTDPLGYPAYSLEVR